MKKITIRQNVLALNNEIAGNLRRLFTKHKLFTINLISSPGAGKTTLLEKTIQHLKSELNMLILVGDVQTEEDANRLNKAGGNAFQIITEGTCHLDARMVKKELEKYELDNIDLLIIENVGNLVCPASYDIGEDQKVVLVSVAEGDEKPVKYPAIFYRAGLFIISKMDMLSVTNFETRKAEENAKKLNPKIDILQLSAKTGEGLDNWLNWLRDNVKQKQKASNERKTLQL